jgi:hypothetical protein
MGYPDAPVVGMSTDGVRVTQVVVKCPFCRGCHTHDWFGDAEGLRSAHCNAFGAVYRVTIDTWARIRSMRQQYPADDGVVGLIPLHIGYAFEVDGNEDVVGVVLDSTLGRFAVWLPLAAAVAMASQLVDIAGNAEALRAAYTRRQAGLTPVAVAS